MEAIPETMTMPLYKCPRCKEYPGAGKNHNAYIVANDGGSTSCYKCGCLHHVCISGIKVGSPGPEKCELCSHIDRNARSTLFISDHIQAGDAWPYTQPQKPAEAPAVKQHIMPNMDMRLPYSIRSQFAGYK